MDSLFAVMSAVVVGSALLAWLASQTRQPVIGAYFLCGILLGPAGAAVAPSADVLHGMSRFGTALLLFLAGMVLHPDRLRTFFRAAVVATLAKAVLSWVIVYGILKTWGYASADCAVAAIALMFSSTILVVKLLPTTTLHQRRMGSLCIAILIAEDLLAVLAILFIGTSPDAGGAFAWLPVKVLALVVLAVVGEQYVVRRMMRRADRYGEVLIMLCLGWCVGVSLLGGWQGIPYEVGAFVAGVTMARGQIARVLSEQLKPLRDFFVMFFFFALGASFDVAQWRGIWLPAAVLSLLIAILRPISLWWLFRRLGEENEFAKEAGIRLGQASEFALVIAVAAAQSGQMSNRLAQLVQLVAVLTMLISSYVVVLRCPTPIGVQPGLQRD